MSSQIRTVAAALTLMMTAASLKAADVRYYRAVTHEKGMVFLLGEDGTRVYAHRPDRSPVVTLECGLTSGDGKQPWRWSKTPFAFVRLGGSWLVVNGTSSLEVFASSGQHLRTAKMPIPATAAFSNGLEMWIYSALPSTSGPRFWRTRDGESFAPVPFDLPVGNDVRGRFLELQLAGGLASDGTLYLAQLVGPPQAWQLRADGTVVRQFGLAYSRTMRRNLLTRYKAGANDPTEYSSPAAEIVFNDQSTMILRNREDVRVDGAIVEQERRRADVYDAAGRHRGTAIFTEGVRTITGFSEGVIRALVTGDRVISARVSAPEQGRVIE